MECYVPRLIHRISRCSHIYLYELGVLAVCVPHAHIFTLYILLKDIPSVVELELVVNYLTLPLLICTKEFRCCCINRYLVALYDILHSIEYELIVLNYSNLILPLSIALELIEVDAINRIVIPTIGSYDIELGVVEDKLVIHDVNWTIVYGILELVRHIEVLDCLLGNHICILHIQQLTPILVN